MEYKIEKNVPLPRRDIAKYPFPEMAIGDSFAIPAKERHAARSSAVNYSAVQARHDPLAPKIRFTIRREKHHYRVWRIAPK